MGYRFEAALGLAQAVPTWSLVRDGLILSGISLVVLMGICLCKEPPRFWRWLRSEHYGDSAKCRLCGRRNPKTGMYHHRVYGWFCTEAEYLEMRQEYRW